MGQLDAKWQQLRGSEATEVFQLVDASHPLDFYIGKSPGGALLFMLVTGEAPPPSRDLESIKLRSLKRDDGRWSFLIELADGNLREVFGHLCEDLIDTGRRVPDSKRPLRPLLKRLAQWLDLLSRRRSGVLDESAIRGLFGELVTLRDVVASTLGVDGACRAWVGPWGADQDFRSADFLWEAKTIHPDGASIRISSEQQLAFDRSGEIVVVSLSESSPKQDGALTLNALVDDIRGQLAIDLHVRDRLDECLAEARYVRRPEYDAPHFIVKSVRRFAFSNELPRVVPLSLPFGVQRVEYDLLVSALERFEIQE